ncbi:MAG TPA: copper chaperone PCu(A)C [Candidatus Sulfotelmatobacter sp.]|nr:copper chaperone PCu(A)C [Candidatus Sulfotelmatobacter sp.]
MRHQITPAALRAVVLSLTVTGLAAMGWAQAQTITATDAWARRASAMASMGKTGSMGEDTMSGDKGGAMGHNMGHNMSNDATSAVYLTLSNAGSQPDALVSAATDAARTVELHEVVQEGGVMKMRPIPSIPVPAGGKVELKPGGYHIMLLGLTHDLKPGDKVAVTLKFDHGGELRVDAAVR